MEDEELVQQAREGDVAAFELLVRRHAVGAWRFARSVLDDDFAAEEAVQDAFLRAHRGLDGFRCEAAFSTWLLTIVRRACLDRLRLKQAPVVSLEEVRVVRSRQESAHLRVILEEAVAALAPVEREAFTLVDVLGYSREEAAGVVGVPASTMRSRVARARERLAESLAGESVLGAEA